MIFLLCLLFLEFAINPCCLHKTSSDNSRKMTEDHFSKKAPPRPFQFGYSLMDKNGNTMHHEAQGDITGKISGTYGYTLSNGLYRRVIYVADSNGYRPVVQTNEPGTGKENPAAVIMDVKPVPEAVARGIATHSGGKNAHNVQKPFSESSKTATANSAVSYTGISHHSSSGGYGSRSSHADSRTAGLQY